jgi:cyclic-di-GMP-binding protein
MNFMPVRHPSSVDYNNPAQCHALLQNIAVTDLEAAGRTLSDLLEGMAVASPPPKGQLDVLEAARPTLDFVLSEVAKRYASRPLPPSGNEEETLRQVVRLWSLMSTNYGFVAQRFALEGNGALDEHRALLLQRRLRYHTLAMTEYFRARQEMPENAWRDLHQLYLSAERANVATTRVPDMLNETWGAQSALESYVAMLLTDAASPYSRTPREFVWVVRWAQRFAPYCSLQDEAPRDTANLYLLEPDSDHGLRPSISVPLDSAARSLNTSKLASHIQAVVSQLKSGVSAASLGLGDDCIQPACARLVVSLYRPWGLASSGRKFPRRLILGQIQVSTDPVAVAYFLTGKKFEQPEDHQIHYNDFERSQVLLTFGERAEETEPTDAELEARALALGYVQESWDVLDSSVAGFRLMRQQGESRIDHRQLIGIRPQPNQHMLLAEISWLQYQQNGSLCAGVSLMPGPAQVLPVRLIVPERANKKERFRLGFLIPGVPALKTDSSLIVPAGWYVSGRQIEVEGETPWIARMTHMVTRGSNFDRISFAREEVDALRQNGR